MSLSGEYLGMPVLIDDLDKDNQTFYRYCAHNELRVQECLDCGLKRLPPTSACPFCASERVQWSPVEGRGTVYSYGEVHHAIQSAFRLHAPYQLLLVELDEQKDIPNPYDGLRLQGNLAEIDGSLATKETVKKVGGIDWDRHHGNGTEQILSDPAGPLARDCLLYTSDAAAE